MFLIREKIIIFIERKNEKIKENCLIINGGIYNYLKLSTKILSVY